MSLSDRLTDGPLLPQLKLNPRIGGLKEQAGHAIFYVSVPMTLVNWSVGYYATPLQSLLPIWLWYAMIPFLYGGAIVFHHVVVHKSWVAFNSGQGADTDVNPQYRRMLEDHDKLLEEVRELRAALEKET